MSVWWRYLWGIAILIAVALAFVHWYGPSSPESLPAGPQTMGEVIGIAQDLGLHYRSDRLDGVIDARLVVSELPFDFERTTQVTFERVPTHPAWNRTVAVYRKVHPARFNVQADTYPLVPWGNFLLYGDPALIKRLTSQK